MLNQIILLLCSLLASGSSQVDHSIGEIHVMTKVFAEICFIPEFEGHQTVRGSKDHSKHRYQYGYSSHPERVDPALIAFPKNVEDVCRAVKYAKHHGLRVAVRTGGHQYSAASSTVGDNIQLDMSTGFHDFDDSQLASNGTISVGVSLTLAELNKRLGELHCFVPHGQCSHIHIGGHAQTGGYGQLSRGFGLFGDHIQQISVVSAEGEQIQLSRDAVDKKEKDWFFAFLGGSPGNYGILHHLVVKVHKNSSHPRVRGLKFVSLYNKQSLVQLLNIKARMAEKVDLVGDLDFCITVLSNTIFCLEDNFGIDADFKRLHPHLFGKDELPAWPAGIVVMAQWSNSGGVSQSQEDEEEAVKWLDEIYHAGDHDLLVPRVFSFNHTEYKTMSDLTHEWLFFNVREFDLPYDKRTYMTNSTTLVTDKWAEWVANRIDDGIHNKHLKVSLQVQNFGGSRSRFTTGGSDPLVTGGMVVNITDTSYSWRDSTVCCAMNCFYEHGKLNEAEKWQAKNDAEIGAYFKNQDRRMLWGSFNKLGEKWDLDANWRCYHEDVDRNGEKKIDALRRIKKDTDPDGVLVPNKFCIGWNQYGREAPEATASVGKVAAETDNLAVKAMIHRVKHEIKSGMKELIQSLGENEKRPTDPVTAQQYSCCLIH